MRIPILLAAIVLSSSWSLAAEPDTSRGDRMIAEYFCSETARLRDACLRDVKTLAEWKSRREGYRKQLLDMLGLDPLPKRTKLDARVTSTVQHEKFTVENVHFQSQPGLYVTGNLYVPKGIKKPAPAILYVCGHGRVKVDGVSYGNKVHYQQHGAWFARHGYVCLTIDSLQLGEIEGIHHGTYRHKMWWWNNRGYTPAGVEAWNCIRALDYLQSRKDVDPDRLGVTGRSGGGAYSWWIAAVDDRIKAAVPVAGITDLQNHVVDGCVEGHCDCMYFTNTYGWDYPLVAALVAPRPLMIGNSDADGIFPLDGVKRTHEKVKRIYQLYGAADKLALNVTVGGHKDTPELRKPAFAWFDKHLRDKTDPIKTPAEAFFEPPQLKVLKKLPEGNHNATIQEQFVPAAQYSPPKTADKSRSLHKDQIAALGTKTFGGWPDNPTALAVKQVFSVDRNGVRLTAYDFTSQLHIGLRLYVTERTERHDPELVVLNVLDGESWHEFLAMMRGGGFVESFKSEIDAAPDAAAFESQKKMHKSFKWTMAYVAPRGVGPTAWSADERKATHVRRRFMLLGQTLDGMRVWDVRRAIQTLRSRDRFAKSPLWLQSNRVMAGVTLYASLFEPDITRLDLHELPTTHRDGPILLNVRRVLDMPQAVVLAADRSRVVLYHSDKDAWRIVTNAGKTLGWDRKQFQIRPPLPDKSKDAK